MPGPQLTAASTVSRREDQTGGDRLACGSTAVAAVTAAWAGPGRVAGGCLRLAARGAGPVQRRSRLTPR